jgi:hypothetical protein
MNVSFYVVALVLLYQVEYKEVPWYLEVAVKHDFNLRKDLATDLDYRTFL